MDKMYTLSAILHQAGTSYLPPTFKNQHLQSMELSACSKEASLEFNLKGNIHPFSFAYCLILYHVIRVWKYRR